MSEEDFNWIEKIMSNDKLPKSLRAYVGLMLVMVIVFCVTLILFIVSGEPIDWTIEWNPSTVFGICGMCIWYFLFYKLCSWSDDIKAKERENE